MTRKKGQPHKGWKDSARKSLRKTMTNSDTVTNTITLPLTDEQAMKLAVQKFNDATAHTHTINPPDRVVEKDIAETSAN